MDAEFDQNAAGCIHDRSRHSDLHQDFPLYRGDRRGDLLPTGLYSASPIPLQAEGLEQVELDYSHFDANPNSLHGRLGNLRAYRLSH